MRKIFILLKTQVNAYKRAIYCLVLSLVWWHAEMYLNSITKLIANPSFNIHKIVKDTINIQGKDNRYQNNL